MTYATVSESVTRQNGQSSSDLDSIFVDSIDLSGVTTGLTVESTSPVAKDASGGKLDGVFLGLMGWIEGMGAIAPDLRKPWFLVELERIDGLFPIKL